MIGCTIGEAMERLKNREAELWIHRVMNEFDYPSQTDHYLMKLGAIIKSYITGQATSLEDIKIKLDKINWDDLEDEDLDISDLSQKAKEASLAGIEIKTAISPKRK